MKRLVSLNLALIVLLSLFSSSALAATTQSNSSPSKYLVIDGTTYDATSSTLSGNGWAYLGSSNTLILRNYTGKSIVTNVSLTIRYYGENAIHSDSGYAIYSSKNLTLSSSILSGNRSTLSVSGNLGYAAIRSDGTLTLDTDYLSAFGGKVKALSGNPLVVDTNQFTIWSGSSAATAKQGIYTNQHYFLCERNHNSLTLHGNGGTTVTGDSNVRIYCTVGTPDAIDLYPHTNVFSNDDKLILGWTENPDGSGNFYARDDYCDFVSPNGDTTIYALWESDTNKAIYLNNYYGQNFNGEQRIVRGVVGYYYVLPEQTRNGFQFVGWRGEDNTLYPADTSVLVSGSTVYTAEFDTGSISIAGQLYDAGKDHEDLSKGWRYFCNQSGKASLYIYNNYVGDPISFPRDLDIYLQGCVYGLDNVPAICVDGNVTISISFAHGCSVNPVVLTGGESSSAIDCTGNLTIHVYDPPEGDPMALILCGGENQCAIKAKSINLSSCKVYNNLQTTDEISDYEEENFLLLKSRPYEGPEKLDTPQLTLSLRPLDGKPYLQWSKADHAIAYEVYCSTTKNGPYTWLYTASAAVLDYVHTSAEVGTSYFYKVCAVNGSDTSKFSAAKGVWCDLAQPNITVTNRASDGKPTIAWSKVDGATAYEVYVSNAKDGTYSKLYTSPADDFDIVHIGAKAGKTYFYKICAIYKSNTKCNSAFSNARGVWCDLRRPTVTVTNRASDGKPTITWSKVDGATAYEVYVSNTKNGTYSKLYTAPANDYDVIHTGAKAGKAYFYKVCAIYKTNSKCNSAFSEAKGVYCDLARPALTVTLNRNNKPYLSWSEVAGASAYKVYRSTNGKTWTLMYTAKADDLDVNHTGAVSGTTYYYKVLATCATTSKGNSAYSIVKTFTVP